MTMDDRGIRTGNDLLGKVIVITGGAGVLCTPICRTLASQGAKIAILDINDGACGELALQIRQLGGEAIAVICDVCSKDNLEEAAQEVIRIYGGVDMLINGAGGNKPAATTNADRSFFDLPGEAVDWVFNLNLIGTIFTCQVFGKIMAEKKSGIILNISSVNAFRPLTRVPAYSAAKAAVSNFTQWMAVYMAQECSAEIRVNAIAPGFFLTDQNRYLLTDQETGALSKRGQAIIDHTPMKRFGNPEDLMGTVLWLLTPASAFVTGIVVPIDGGFSAFSGV
jgi:NAD(P)-dependent dehydrogenase (short-subunit alcohol dehydrogenase family)